jgi:copper chaperone CopZ
LERLPGVTRADVSLEKAEARVAFEDTKVSGEQLAAAIDRLGFRARLLRVEPAGG